jgi:PAT family beta-lactamase induction signal transducer AmpG
LSDRPSTKALLPGSGRQAAGRDRLLFAVLYFAEGVPIGFVWWALPAVLREQSMDLGRITTLTAVLALPWTLKFLAGPLVDRSVARGGRLRSWILACQVVMGLTLLPLAAGSTVPGFDLLLGLLLAHACFAAVQDVAIDALCIRTVSVDHLGSINGWMQFGMTAGRATAAASVPLLIKLFGWQPAVWTIAALIWAPMIIVVSMVHENPVRAGPATTDPAISPTAGHAAQRRSPFAGIVAWMLVPAMGVALLAGSGFEATGALAGPLLVDLQFDAGTRALFFGAVAPAGLALGGLAAARSADRLGLQRAVAFGVAAVAVAVGALAWSLADNPLPVGQWTHVAFLGIVYLGAGFLISASYACFMAVARGRWAATRFSLLMALTNGCETGSALAGGRLAASLGYGAAIVALAGLSLLSLPFLRRVDVSGVSADAEKRND